MSLRVDKKLAEFLREVRNTSPDQKIYLVGGAVRDLVLGKPVKDLDFVVADGSVELAKIVKRRFNGVWYSLDDEHQSARVILKQGDADELVLDFTAFIGETLEQDLRQRDFTINAMAIDLDNLEEVIDPLGGQNDLRDGQLCLGNPQSLISDPLRVLRAVRMVRTLELSHTDEITENLRVATKGLNRISGERIRDELLKCLALPNLSLTYELLKNYGILDQLLHRTSEQESLKKLLADSPGENLTNIDDDFEQNFLQTLEKLILYIEKEDPDSSDFDLCPVSISLPDILKKLNKNLGETLQGGRTRKQLLILFAMFFPHYSGYLADNQKEVDLNCLAFAESITNAFMLGQKEKQFFELVCAGYWEIFSLDQEARVSALQIYRYFRRVGSYGVESAVLHLVNYCASSSLLPEKISIADAIIFTWFREQTKIVDPPRIVDGDDLQKILHLNSGPELGFYLESIREAQVTGGVKTRDEALAHVTRLIGERK